MPDPVDEFPGFLLSGKAIQVKIDGINGTARKIATWTAKKDPEKSAGTEFVWLGRKLSIFIESKEFQNRFPPGNRDTLVGDLKKNNADCGKWSNAGVKILNSSENLFKEITLIPTMKIHAPSLLKFRAEPTNEKLLNELALTDYAIVWRGIGSAAFDFSVMYTARIPMGDYKFRFFCGPVNPKVTIYFSPLADWLAVGDTFQTLVNEMLESAEKKPTNPDWRNSFEIKTLSLEDADKGPYMTISENPFRYFRTLVGTTDLSRLVEQLVSPQLEWKRDWPDLQKVATFNNALTLGSQTRQAIAITAMQFITGDLTKEIVRIPTEQIMGKSANKWAKDELKWEAGNCNVGQGDKVVAEWLHRSASSFRNYGAGIENPDTVRNLMFGTQECNTHMLRAESAIHSFYHRARAIENLNVEKSGATLITSVVWRGGGLRKNGGIVTQINEGLVWKPGKGYKWIVPQLDYEVAFKLVILNKTDQLFKYKTSFFPFHRYCPLRPEVSLDTRVLNYYFDKVLFPPLPADPPTKESV